MAAIAAREVTLDQQRRVARHDRVGEILRQAHLVKVELGTQRIAAATPRDPPGAAVAMRDEGLGRRRGLRRGWRIGPWGGLKGAARRRISGRL